MISNKINIHFDMETNDPDDAMVLALAATHPRVNLVGVTVTPGGSDQVGLVHHVLDMLGHPTIPVGARSLKRERPSVSSFHRKWLGDWHLKEPDGEGCDIIASAIEKYPDVTLLTGGPLHNPGRLLLKHPEMKIQIWVGQGGFAGDAVVDPEYRLPQFIGHNYFATFNFNGDVESAKLMLTTNQIEKRYLASKNVCHGVRWSPEMQEKARQITGTKGFELVKIGMEMYLKNNDAQGKKLHDPIALAVAIDSSVCEFAEVTVQREKGKWGAFPSKGSNTWISKAIDLDKFQSILFEN